MAENKRDSEARIAELEADLVKAQETISSLQESNSQLNSIIENTDDYILFSDATAAPLFWNSAYAAIMKELLDLDLSPGIKPHELLEDAEARDFWEGLHARVLAGEKFRAEFQYPVTPEDVRTFEISFNPIVEDGKVRGFSEFTREITDRKNAERERTQLQQQLLQSQKMEALGKLAGGMAHDFNNVLAIILGTAELLLALARLDAPDHARVGKIVKMAKRGRDITTKLLAFARREQPETLPTPVEDLCRDLLDILEGSVPKNIQLHTSLSPESALVDVAAGQVTLALLNICLNACDAMPDGGRLDLECEVVTRWPKQYQEESKPERSTWCRLRVSDHGKGIPKEVLDRIFEPFFTTKPRGRGTGLGLAMSLGIIEGHGGWIEVSSGPSQGTSVDVFLPSRSGEAGVRSRPTPAKPLKRSGWSILVVDDEVDFLATLSDQLRSLGHTVHLAHGGAGAIELYRKEKTHIDLVMLDIMMPRLDGRATFEALREIEPEVKVVLCSGYSLKGQAEEMLSKGALGLLQKPFDLAELVTVLSRVMSDE